MKTKHLTREEALDLAQTPEGHFFDRKAKAVSGKGLQKVVVAFANADGGEVLVGIADDQREPDISKRWDGFEYLDEANGILQAVFSLQPSVQIRHELLTSDFKGKVLSISVEKSSQVHKTSDGTVFVRYGAQSLPLQDPQKIIELTYAKGASSFEDNTLPQVRAEVIADSPVLSSFLRTLSPKTDNLDYVFNQNLLDPVTWQPKVAGILLFAQNPPAFVPTKCGVKVVRYETREDEPERDHLKFIEPLEGPLYELINLTIEKVTEIMSSVTVWTTSGLGQVSYPPEAIWEIVVNAIVHRDYSIADDVQIRIFDDRIEVQSPGRLPGYVNVDNILDARFSRNPKIVRTLNWYPDPPNKDLGEGLNTAFQKMKEWGLRSPEIREHNNSVLVTLPHTPLATPSEAIMNFLQANTRITNRQARDITGIRSENLVKQEFYKLRDQNYIERVPGLEGPKSAWQLTRHGTAYIKAEGSRTPGRLIMPN
jgi:ATP-dependent DNA helicase RecG